METPIVLGLNDGKKRRIESAIFYGVLLVACTVVMIAGLP
jgi:hypothetical protein